MRIFLAGTSFDPSYGGPAVSVAGLAANLARAGAEVGLWAPDGSAVFALPDTAPNVERLGGALPDALAQFGKTDVVHDNGIWLSHNHALAKTCRRAGLPRIVSVRGMLEPWAFRHKGWKKRIAWQAYQKRDLQSAASLHATSEQEAGNLKRLGLGVRIATVPNGIVLPGDAALAAARARFAQRDVRTALFLGRLYPVKGLPMLVEAWGRVRPKNWRLQIAGPDEAGHRKEIERAIRTNNLEDCVHLVGAVAAGELTNAYAGADLFVLPSYSESFGMVVVEALAHGLPVLTTTGTPWPALPLKGCGWQVPASVDAIAAALAEAVSCEPEVLQEMGAKGRAYAQAEFGWQAVADSMMEIYRIAVRGGCMA